MHFINQKVPCHAVYKILLVFSTFPASSSSFFTSFLFSFGFNYFVLKALTDSDPYRTGKRQFCADGPDFLKQWSIPVHDTDLGNYFSRDICTFKVTIKQSVHFMWQGALIFSRNNFRSVSSQFIMIFFCTILCSVFLLFYISLVIFPAFTWLAGNVFYLPLKHYFLTEN